MKTKIITSPGLYCSNEAVGSSIAFSLLVANREVDNVVHYVKGDGGNAKYRFTFFVTELPERYGKVGPVELCEWE